MPLIPNPTSKILQHVLGYQNQRHDVISANIANVSTPGYRAFDVVLQGEMSAGKSLEPRTSDPRHMSIGDAAGLIGSRLEVSRAPARLDGNNVSLDDQFMKLTENRMRYQIGFELMDRWGSLMRLAREVR